MLPELDCFAFLKIVKVHFPLFFHGTWRVNLLQRTKNTLSFSLVPERSSPELCGIRFGDSEVIPLKQAVGKDGFELREHVTEYQRQFRQVPSEIEEREQLLHTERFDKS